MITLVRNEYGLLTETDATRALALMNRNRVREAATDLWDAAGADFDGLHVSLLRDGQWTTLHRDMNRALERHMVGR